MRRRTLGDTRKVSHFLLEARPGQRAVAADAHVARRGEDEGQLEGKHAGRVCSHLIDKYPYCRSSKRCDAV